MIDKKLKIALVHDDLVQWGGAERLLVALSEMFPDAPIYTSVFNRHHPILKKYFSHQKIVTSFIQKIPGWQSFYKALLPLYPIAFEQFNFSDFDIVISQTTRFAKSIITKPATFHICYCHTPPRFLWNFSGDKTYPLLSPYFHFLKKYDQISSSRIDLWVAGSKNAKRRIEQVYQVPRPGLVKLIYPFVDLKRFVNISPFDGGYLLVVSRLNAYKKIDLVVRVANILQIPLKIVGMGPEEGRLKKLAGPTVEFVGLVDEEILAYLLAGCKALVVAGEEDFGLTPLEAQVLGKPVIAYKKGGVLETVIKGETGYLFDEQSVSSLTRALFDLDKRGYNQKKCQMQAQKFSKEQFKENFQKLLTSL